MFYQQLCTSHQSSESFNVNFRINIKGKQNNNYYEMMNTINIEETKSTPRVELNPDGNLLFQGRSLPIDPAGFYNPIINWILECRSESINLDLRLDYLNTSSAKQLYTIMLFLKNNSSVKSFTINWYYEGGDEDGYNTGREFESLIEIPFKFHEYAEIND